MWSKFVRGRRVFFSPNLNLVNLSIQRTPDSSLRFNKLFQSGGYRWRWISKISDTEGRNQTDFNNMFLRAPSGSGITLNTDINWTDTSNKPPYLPEDNFAWEVTTNLRIDISGEYQFNTRSDDSNQLEIDGEIVTSFYGGRGLGPGEDSIPIFLSIGNHLFRYRMEEGAGASAAQVRWKTPVNDTFVPIPPSVFMVSA